MQTSALGRAFITRQEGCVLHVYKDQAGISTIGVGHVLRPGDPITITAEQADAMLTSDLRVAESCINSCVTVRLEQNEFDALVSFTFNVGTGAFSSSTMLRLLNAGDRQGAADEFCKWDHITVNGVKSVSPGLLARRNDETTLFLGTDGPTTDPGMKRPSQV